MCAVEMLTGSPLLPGQTEIHQLDLLKKVIGGPEHDPEQIAPPGPRGSGAWSGHSIHRPSSDRTRRLYDIIANCKYSPFLQVEDDAQAARSTTTSSSVRESGGDTFPRMSISPATGAQESRAAWVASNDDAAEATHAAAVAAPASAWQADPPPKPLTNVTTALLLSELVDLLARMMSWDPKKRPLAGDALGHPFFRLAASFGL